MYRKTMKNFAVIHWAHMIYETTRASLGHMHLYIATDFCAVIGSLLYISNSISSHSTHTVGTASSDWNTGSQKWMDKVLSSCPQY